MKLGVFLPLELTRPSEVRDFVQAAEELGYDHVGLGDHVLGIDPATVELKGPYTNATIWHEPMVTMGYLAAVTQRIGLTTGVLILPQRQAVLAAKQAAQVDYLSGGRLRMGIGVGWNPVEYDALNVDFRTRGKRIDEQIAVMRALWTQDLVTLDGDWHHIDRAGINPLPVQRPIPIWLGGWSPPVIDRLARSGDGWLLYADLENGGKQAIAALHRRCEEVGRDPAKIGIEGWVILNHCDVGAGERQRPGAEVLRTEEEWAKDIRAWRDAGATHLNCWTSWGKLYSVDEHIALARRFKAVAEALSDSRGDILT